MEHGRPPPENKKPPHHWNIETVRSTCVIYPIGRPDSAFRYSERKWSLTAPVLSRSSSPRPSKRATSKTAGPRADTTSADAVVSKARPDVDEILKLILSRLEDMKAEDTVTIDLRGKSAFSDYMVVTTGRSNRHVGAVAENVAKGLKETGVKKVHIEGLPNCDWVLIDSGDVIVHVFRPEVREFYNLERLWIQNTATAKTV
jgi:ribosome-associated protein